MRCELCLGSGSGHESMEGRGSCGPSAKLGEHGQLWPRAERERLQEKKARRLAPGLQLRPVLPGDRNARIQKQAQGRRREEPGPRGCLQSQPCSPSLSGLLTHLCPTGAIRRENKLFRDNIWASYFSETQPRGFQGKGRRQGGRGSPTGCAKCWSGGICLLPCERLAWGAPACDRSGGLWAAGQAGANGAGSVLLVGCLGTLDAVGR